MHNVTANGGSVVFGDEVRASQVRGVEQDGAGAGLDQLGKPGDLLDKIAGQQGLHPAMTCDVVEELVDGDEQVVEEQLGILDSLWNT